MADDKLNAALLADLGVANRERLLAAPDARDHSLRGRLKSNGTDKATAQQSNGSGDASISGWKAFAKFNEENVGEGDLADLHGGQLHRQNREAMSYGNPRPAPASFPRPSLPLYNKPQDRTPLNVHDRPSPTVQAPAHVQPMNNGKGVRGGTKDALELARSMQFRGSYSGKSRGHGMHGNPAPRGPRGGYGGSDFRGGRGGFEPRTDRDGHAHGGPDFCGDRGGSLGKGGPGHNSFGLGRSGHGTDAYGTAQANTHPSAVGPRGHPAGHVTSSLSSRGRGDYNIRGAASRRSQPSLTSNGNREPVVRNGMWKCAEDDTEPVYDNVEENGPLQRRLPVTKRPQQLVSNKEFMSAIMGSKWAPKKS